MRNIIISITVSILIIAGALVATKNNVNLANQNVASVGSVTLQDGVQIVEIKAKGGYIPRTSIAKAGLPTILRFNTEGTFDCSSSVRIPSLNISQNLPLSGVTDISLPIQKAGTLQGTCSMGMYPFEVVFQD